MRLMMTLICALFFVLWLTGRMPLRSVLCTPIMFGPLELVAAFAKPSVRSGTWVFPGGLRGGRQGWIRGHVFRRDAALLCWYGGTNVLHVREGKKFRIVRVTPREADLAIRAWLSRATSPTDEQLRALLPD
jgi:hypothetical protein